MAECMDDSAVADVGDCMEGSSTATDGQSRAVVASPIVDTVCNEAVDCQTGSATTKQLPQPMVGEYYSAVKVGKGWRRAEVISRRENSRINSTEYFVHFDGDDRRMDTWIPEQMIDASKMRTHESPEAKRGEAVLKDIQGAVTRSQRSRLEANDAYSYYAMDPETYALEKEREKATRVKHISQIRYGEYRVNAWYYSPYLMEYGTSPHLYICDRCFKYMRHSATYKKHRSHCSYDNIPGKVVYRKDKLFVVEVDGEDTENVKSWVYCQNLCLLSKLFLDHKTVCYDVDPFWFYVLYEESAAGPRGAGYFSKEKWPFDNNNLSCITVFPPHQRKGYGSFLIQFSYLLSSIEGVIGGPERPLSDFGRKSYRNFWIWKLSNVFKANLGACCSLKNLSDWTGILQNDLIETLRALKIRHFYKGLHLVPINDSTLSACFSNNVYKSPTVVVDPAHLNYMPHLYAKRAKGSRRSSFPINEEEMQVDNAE